MSDAHARDGRPSPEALLALAEREGRGRLKIHLGAAPGVGKTYTMLSKPAASPAKASTWWSVWSRPTAAPRRRH